MRVQIIEASCNRRSLEVVKLINYFGANGCSVISEKTNVDKNADIIYFSSCGFTQTAEDYALKILKRIKENMKSNCRIIVGGCLPKIHKEAVSEFLSIDPRNYEKIDEYFPSFYYKYSDFSDVNTYGNNEFKIPESILSDVFKDINLTRGQKVKALEEYIKSTLNDKKEFRIQCMVGCPCKCTYCAIKFAVGNLKSNPPEVILQAVKNAIAYGYEKIYFEGDSLGAYGKDIGTNIGELLDEVIKLVKDINIKVSVADIAPFYLDKCIEQIVCLGKIGKLIHFYVPIQSASTKILSLMKRSCDIKNLKEQFERIKRQCPHVKLGTSVIVGFPGETEEDFDDTINFCYDVHFNYVW